MVEVLRRSRWLREDMRGRVDEIGERRYALKRYDNQIEGNLIESNGSDDNNVLLQYAFQGIIKQFRKREEKGVGNCLPVVMEMTRKVQKMWGEEEEKKKRIAEDEASTDALPIEYYDDLKGRKMNMVKEEDKEEEGTKKRKGGHIKMITRKRARKQSDVNSDDEHKKCLKIVTFESILDAANGRFGGILKTVSCGWVLHIFAEGGYYVLCVDLMSGVEQFSWEVIISWIAWILFGEDLEEIMGILIQKKIN
ncbi:hypothetical protein Tco_0321414 [Tanacetum coccineum]